MQKPNRLDVLYLAICANYEYPGAHPFYSLIVVFNVSMRSLRSVPLMKKDVNHSFYNFKKIKKGGIIPAFHNN